MEKKKVGVWIKASERLPTFEEVDKKYVVRFCKIPDEVYSRTFGWISDYEAAYYDIEWLEEKEVYVMSEEEVKIFNKVKDTLLAIAKWETPETDMFYDEEKKRPVSYETAYGSNGVRDYFKSLATIAYNEITTT